MMAGRYSRCVDLTGVRELLIGNEKNCHFVLYGLKTEELLQLEAAGQGLRIRRLRGNMEVCKNGAKAPLPLSIRSGDFFSAGDYQFFYRDHQLYTEAREDLAIRLLPWEDLIQPSGYPLFRRTTRIRSLPDLTPVEILDPPALPAKPEEKWFLRLLPSLGMLAAAGFMAARGGTMMFLISGMSAAAGVFSAVAGTLGGNRKYQKEQKRRRELYEYYIYRKTREIIEKRRQELEVLNRIYLPLPEVKERVRSFSEQLFDRCPEDEDFLQVCLGKGEILARQPIQVQKRERLEQEDSLQEIPEELEKTYQKIFGGPVTVDLRRAGILGIAGREEDREILLRTMVMDLAVRQFYGDVRMIFIALPEQSKSLHWLRLLPHVQLTDTLRGLALEEESKNEIFEYLYKELSNREQKKEQLPHLLVFLWNDWGFCSHPLSGFTDRAPELGVTFLFMADHRLQIPGGCRFVVDLISRDRGYLVDTGNIRESILFSLPEISLPEAEAAAGMLAPVYTEEVSLEQSLPERCSFFDLLQIRRAEEWDLEHHWKQSLRSSTLAVPIGISRQGILTLDLHEQGQGPHGLVAGTTGSGKSEILLTYILSAAIHMSPEEIGFLIIDFKGGGMAHRLTGLPHLAGVITNMEGQTVQRSLRFLRAELLRRQRQLDEAGVSHIGEYRKKRRRDPGLPALPHLVIIVDEFAELRAEHPDFMKELISAARIGRSLGVHLILATQKPSGQVSEQIWSNSRFRICLKVQDKSDSSEVIKSPLAAEIKEPGRGILQVGNNEQFELFQSAYCQGPVPGKDPQIRPLRICEVSDSGRKTPVYIQGENRKEEGCKTQLEAMLDHIRQHCEQKGFRPLPLVCLPVLPERIPFPCQWKGTDPLPELSFPVGLCDDPDRQRQQPLVLDLSSRNLLITGGAQSGKTQFLQCLLRSGVSTCTPEELHIYLVDFGSGHLRSFEKLPQVGGVAGGMEEEALQRMLRFLEQQLRPSRSSRHPAILLLIDGLEALCQQYPREEERLLRLFREGISAGIHVAAATGRAGGIPGRFLSCFEERLALFSNDPGEYNLLYEHCRMRPAQIPGRCLVQKEKEMYECQIYEAFADTDIQNWVEEMKQKYQQYPAADPVPSVPRMLTGSYIQRFLMPDEKKGMEITAGMEILSARPLVLDLQEQTLLTVMGSAQRGRDDWVRYLLGRLQKETEAQIYLTDHLHRPFAGLRDEGILEEYSVVPGRAVDFLCRMEQILAVRYEEIMEDEALDISRWPLQLLVLHGMEVLRAVCSDPKGQSAYHNLMEKYQGLRGMILVLLPGNVSMSYTGPEILRDARDLGQVLYFGDLPDFRLFDIPMARLREMTSPEYGEALYMKGGDCRKIKVPVVTTQKEETLYGRTNQNITGTDE